jgi:hypothetical protein
MVLKKLGSISKCISSCYSSMVESRNQVFEKLTSKDLSFFESLIGSAKCITDPVDLEPYNTDWLKINKGNGAIALLPSTTQELSAILKYCNERRLAVCPQGLIF